MNALVVLWRSRNVICAQANPRVLARDIALWAWRNGHSRLHKLLKNTVFSPFRQLLQYKTALAETNCKDVFRQLLFFNINNL